MVARLLSDPASKSDMDTSKTDLGTPEDWLGEEGAERAEPWEKQRDSNELCELRLVSEPSSEEALEMRRAKVASKPLGDGGKALCVSDAKPAGTSGF